MIPTEEEQKTAPIETMSGPLKPPVVLPVHTKKQIMKLLQDNSPTSNDEAQRLIMTLSDEQVAMLNEEIPAAVGPQKRAKPDDTSPEDDVVPEGRGETTMEDLQLFLRMAKRRIEAHEPGDDEQQLENVRTLEADIRKRELRQADENMRTVTKLLNKHQEMLVTLFDARRTRGSKAAKYAPFLEILF